MTASTDAAATPAVAGPTSPSTSRCCRMDGTFPRPTTMSRRRYVERTSRGLLRLLAAQRSASSGSTTSGRRELGDTQFNLVKVDSVSGYDIEMMNDPDLVLLHILMRGNAQLQQGSTTVDAAPAQMVLLEGMGRSHKRWHGSTQLLMVAAQPKPDGTTSSPARPGSSIGDPLNFGVMQVLDLERVSTLVELHRHDLPGPQRPAARASTAISAGLPSATLAAAAAERRAQQLQMGLRRRCGCRRRRRTTCCRVENYIREHAREPISADDLVSVGGVSARSIYHGFRRFPLDHADGLSQGRAPRLARDALVRGRRQGTTSVTEAATAAGYTNLSQFSRDYKARFREAPSRPCARRLARRS